LSLNLSLVCHLPPEISFNLTDIREKISRNQLTEEVNFLLTMGKVKAKEVVTIEHSAILSPKFPEKTKGRVCRVSKIANAGIKGDAFI